jgi:hypothetical protein
VDAHEQRRFRLAVPAAWVGVATGMFLYLSDLDATDDYAGWIIAMVVLQIPAYLAVVTAAPDRPFGRGRAFALAIPAALIVALAAFFIGGIVGIAIWRPVPFELRPYALGLGAALVGLAVGLARHVRMVRRVSHPRGVRGVLARVTIVGLIAVIALATRWSEASREPGIWLAVVTPVLWTVPLWLVARTSRRLPEARLRAAS